MHKLTAWRANPRRNDEAVERVAWLIVVYGWGAPMIARRVWAGDHRLSDPVPELIAGHTRAKALLWLLAQPEKLDSAGRPIAGPRFVPQGVPDRFGPGFVPVRFMDHLDEDQAHLLAVADNKANEIATWDEGGLVALLRSVPEERLPDSAFSQTELRALLAPWSPSFTGPAQEIGDKGRHRILVRVELGKLDAAERAIAAALTAAGIAHEIG